MSLCARKSASRTAKPISRSMAATSVLPLAMPPVRPSRSIARSPRAGNGLYGVSFGFATAQARGFHGVAHQHGDGHGANAAGDGRERAGGVHRVGMHVADEHRTLFAEFFQARGEIAQQRLRFFGISHLVRANIDDRSAGRNPVGLYIAGLAHGSDDDI